MKPYVFEAISREGVVSFSRFLPLRDIADAWPKIVEMANAIDRPGFRIRVSDEAGDIVIMVGVASVRLHDGFRLQA